MSYDRQSWSDAAEYRGNSITFCSCVPCGTHIEQNLSKREIRLMWIKDTAAGAGLILFMVSAFVLASGAHAALNVHLI
jgi:hypothetical protein